MNTIILDIFKWIKDDYRSNRIRFAVELLAWAISIGCSITMALTVPNPPLLALYYDFGSLRSSYSINYCFSCSIIIIHMEISFL